MQSGQWMYNFGDEEHWDEGEYFDTKEETIDVGREEAIAREEVSYQVGQLDVFEPSIDVYNVLDNICSNACDECGEFADGYPHATKEEIQKLQDMLDEVLERWMDKTNNRPNFFTIKNTEEILINKV